MIMNWDEEKLQHLPQKNGFRMRGMEMTRLETFMDAAFAFATTMLVISVGSIPESYQELVLALKGTPAFAASFASITSLWVAHRTWSRRYGLEDMPAILISLCLIFIMLIYVYPLKMLFSAMFFWLSGGWLPASFRISSISELNNLFVIYGLGFAAVMLMITMLYGRALQMTDRLRLNALEQVQTRGERASAIVLSLTGLASALYAWLMPTDLGVYAGFVYMTLPVTMTFSAISYSKKEKRITLIEKSQNVSEK